MRCVGTLREDAGGNVLEVGVPLGVIVALCPSTSPVSTAIYKALLAIKSGNAIIFSLHPRAVRCMKRTLDLLIAAAEECGLPEGCVSYLATSTRSGTIELMRHPATSLVLLTGVVGMLDAAQASGKPLICGGTGNGPAFIERSADVRQAVEDILFSKSFDCGIAPSAEQCVVVDSRIAEEARRAFQEQGAYFMREKEVQAMAGLFFHHDGRRRRDMIGLDAATLARRAGFEVPAGTRCSSRNANTFPIRTPTTGNCSLPSCLGMWKTTGCTPAKNALNCFCSIAPGIRWSSTPATRKSYASSH